MKKIYKNTDLFEKMPVHKSVMHIAWPTIIATLATIIYNLTDQFFVGHLNDANQSAAVTLAGNITLLYIFLENLFGIGGSSLMGRAMGEHKYELAKKTTSFCFWAAIVASVIFSVLYEVFKTSWLYLIGASPDNINYIFQYMYFACTLGAVPTVLSVVLSFLLRTEGDSFHATIGIILGCAMNVLLNTILVWPEFLNMGIAGAGLATLLSNIISSVYMIIWILKKNRNSFISLNIKYAIPTKYIIKEVIVVGGPAAIQNLLNVLSVSVLNNFVSIFGAEAIAAMGISYKIYIMPMLISISISQSAMPIVSYNYGSKNYPRLIQTIKFSFALSLAWITIASILIFATSRFLISLFINLEEVVVIGDTMLKLLALGLPFLVFDFLVVAIYQACGKGVLTLWFAILRKIIFEIPLLYLLNAIMPMYGLSLAAPVAEVFMTIITAIFLYTFINKLKQENDE